eukprot:9514932-Alexandrium_andersonii.AAC.1
MMQNYDASAQAAPRTARPLRFSAWPVDVATPAEINALRSPVVRGVTLNVLSPEFAHGFALALLAKRGHSMTIRIFGPLGVNSESLCRRLLPDGATYVLADM